MTDKPWKYGTVTITPCYLKPRRVVKAPQNNVAEKKQHVLVAFGGGTNSTALLVGLYERGERPDAITFADTGGEKPYTYEHISHVQKWLTEIGFPPITILAGYPYWTPQMVRDGSLEAMCVRLGVLPSKAYGGTTCSVKWKVEPQMRFTDRYCVLNKIRASQITRMIGFDYGEPARIMRAFERAEKNIYKERFPLHEWQWTRKECEDAIVRAGLPAAGKSSCFYCPSSKKHEILDLAKNLPELYRRAVEMERKALAVGEGTGKMITDPVRTPGLGRSFNWRDYVDRVTGGNIPEPSAFDDRYCDPSCDTCYDG